MNLRKEVFQRAIRIIRMSTKATEHMEKTSNSWRSKVVSEAKVVEIQNISSKVKTLRLQIASKEFSFLSGQWVDFIIPNVDTVGGYSICSSPRYLHEFRMLDLAIKNSSHPPAEWVHSKCQVGDTVLLKVGGQCIWNPENPSQWKHTLFIAGGIGINPLLSMILSIEETRKSKGNTSGDIGSSVLLYSASKTNELIFKDKLDNLVRESDKLSCRYFVTKEEVDKCRNISCKRINKDDIIEALKMMPSYKGIQCYICGPPPMINSMNEHLLDSGIEKSNIYYEQWW